MCAILLVELLRRNTKDNIQAIVFYIEIHFRIHIEFLETLISTPRVNAGRGQPPFVADGGVDEERQCSLTNVHRTNSALTPMSGFRGRIIFAILLPYCTVRYGGKSSQPCLLL
jgi:hypothetical protein